jgi:hypothetical protein
LSLRQFYSGVKNAFKAAQEWRQAVVLVRRFFESLAPDRRIEIRYEDLLADPPACFARLAEFLHIEDPEAVVDAIAPDLCLQLKRDNSMKWKRQLPAAEQRVFEQLAGDVLETYGYETRGSRVRPPGLWESLYWNADHAVKQAADSRWWKDNVYRASLRLRESSQRWMRPTPHETNARSVDSASS